MSTKWLVINENDDLRTERFAVQSPQCNGLEICACVLCIMHVHVHVYP